MTSEDTVRRLLSEAVEGIEPSSDSLESIRVGVERRTRRRRRRIVGGASTALAVAALIAGIFVLTTKPATRSLVVVTPPPRPPTTTALGSTELPTLGAAWAPQVSGFGQAMPTGLSLGADPTGIVTGITWNGWGQSQATGQGMSTYVGPNQSVAQGSKKPVTVVAFGLGSCGSRPAYEHVEWFFPTEGQSFDPNAYTSVCSGPGGARNVTVDQPTRTELSNVYVAFTKLPAADVIGPTAGSVYEAYDEASHSYWALASFVPAAGAPLNVDVSMQDGDNEGIFTRDPHGAWTMLRTAGIPFPCEGKTPVPDEVFAVWAMQMVPSSSC